MVWQKPDLFPERRHPTIEELDDCAPNNPVHCMHGGGHICMYNHKALEYLGVYTAEDAKKYPPDEVEVIDGKLTGMVRGHTHFWLWGQVEYTEPQQRKAAMKLLAAEPACSPVRVRINLRRWHNGLPALVNGIWAARREGTAAGLLRRVQRRGMDNSRADLSLSRRGIARKSPMVYGWLG